MSAEVSIQVDDLIDEIHELSIEAASLKAQAASIRHLVVELMREEQALSERELSLLRATLDAADSMVWALSHKTENNLKP